MLSVRRRQAWPKMSESYEEFSEDALMDDFGMGGHPPCPPPLCHQRSSGHIEERFEESPHAFRSLSSFPQGETSSMMEDPYDDPYDEEPVYRSIGGYGFSGLDIARHAVPDQALDRDEHSCRGYPRCPDWSANEASSSAEVYVDEPVYRAAVYRGESAAYLGGGEQLASPSALLQKCGNEEVTRVAAPPADFEFVLPPELFDMVLAWLNPCPDLFAAMECCRSWRDAAQLNYSLRRQTVPASHDALLHAVESAWPGDTLVVAAGFHTLSSEVAVDKPLRFIPGPNGAAVLTSTHHVLLRTRCSACVEGLTLLRLGDEVGYPNAVVYAEAGALTMRSCRITCGGAAPSAAHAMQVFDGAPAAGQPWLGAERPSVVVANEQAAPADTAQDPQSGLWVGAAARVELSDSMILCCQGPGIKIYRGELKAEDNTIAFASRGANVVANGGRVKLLRNEIKGALGDGVTSWNNAHVTLDTNRIHANSGARCSREPSQPSSRRAAVATARDASGPVVAPPHPPTSTPLVGPRPCRGPLRVGSRRVGGTAAALETASLQLPRAAPVRPPAESC